MRVSCRIRSMDFKAVTEKAVQAREKALTATTEAARMDTEPYVPFVTGALRRTADTESKPSVGKLVYGNSAVPYAAAQYYGLPNKTWPGTQMHWFEASKAANSEKWRQIMEREYRRLFGG